MLISKEEVSLDRDLVEACLKLVNQDIRIMEDNPMYGGIFPDYLYVLRRDLENALGIVDPKRL